MRPAIQSESSSPNPAPGVQFSEEKASKLIAPISIGEGILGKNDPSPPKETQNKNIDKANSLLDELRQEERSGIKAEISGLDKSESREDRTNSALTDTKNKKEKSESNYEDEFEEIDEDLPEENELDLSN